MHNHPMTPRPDQVMKLVNAMLTAVTREAGGTTADEVFSAVMTLMAQMMQVALAHGADPAALQRSIEKLWTRTADPRKVN